MNNTYHEEYKKYRQKYLDLKYLDSKLEQSGGLKGCKKMPEQKLPKSCIRITDKKYEKRPSPPYHANDCKNVILKGNDNLDYVSVPDKDGRHFWKKIKEGKTAEEYYFQFKHYDKRYDVDEILKKLNNIKKELWKHKIYFIFIGWENVWDFIDNAWDDAIEIVAKKMGNSREVDTLKVMDNASLIFYTEHRVFAATYDTGEITLQHNILDKDVNIVYDIFKKEFGNRFKWNKKNDMTLNIKLQKI